MGNFSTIQERYHNTILIKSTEEVWHYDIVYSTGTEIRSIRYALIITCRHNIYIYEFPHRSLKDECVLKAMQNFVDILGHKSKRMIVDIDFKVIGGIVADYLELNPNNVNRAPSGRQNQNGLAKIRWKTIMSLCRTWST